MTRTRTLAVRYIALILTHPFDTSSSDYDVERTSRTQTAHTQPGYGLERHRTALSRIATQRSKAYSPPLPENEEYVVEFAGPGDPLHPQNWPTRKKLLVSALLAFTTLNSTLTSSIFSSADSAISAKFNISTGVSSLGMSLYVLSFAFGPTLFSPLSELFGQRLPILIDVFGFTIFQFGVATAENLETVIFCRFFGGFVRACPIAVVAAVFSDRYDTRHCGLAIAIFTMMVFTCPLFAPFIGGILEAAAFVLDVFFVHETYTPVVSTQKAQELRRRTKNWGIHAKQEEVDIDIGEPIAKNLSRPHIQQIHGLNNGVGGLPYFGLIIGQLFKGLFIIAMQPWYNRKLSANGDIPTPECRLPPAIVGDAAFAAGLFWFNWIGYTDSIHWIVPTCLNYMIDTHLAFAASALAANSILCSMASAGYPLFASYMFNVIGVNWTGALFRCVAAVLMPLLFHLYDHRILSKSKLAAEYIAVVKANATEE
ncbi:major facilitator superfamily domain-containing protein [Aspergillus multicolor]|uniref:major facilitator superfamily domain-containing protein n=1 Tax=Aspergillus multicolor TaxID=41759 RepID=UPI003CCCCF96